MMQYILYFIFSILFFSNCGGSKPEIKADVTAHKSNKVSPNKSNDKNVTKEKKQITTKVQVTNKVNENDNIADVEKNTKVKEVSKIAIKKKDDTEVLNEDNPNSNFIRVKTVYELAMDANPSMFVPHDEFETVAEYKIRVSEQVKLMKDIVLITTQKTQIKRAKRLEVAREKELKRRSVIETLMSESSTSVEFTPTDIGRYDPENETFPLVLYDTQYQIAVPREEARTFKTNFESIKIKGIQQLKPKYDVKINVSRAHIRSRPNGSIIGVASEMEQFEHVVDVDEWYKINYKGQFGFTHMNNAELKLVDIDNEFEYHDLVAIHPTTGSFFAMVSIDKLVKAPLNLASRQYESGKPDGPKHSY